MFSSKSNVRKNSVLLQPYFQSRSSSSSSSRSSSGLVVVVVVVVVVEWERIRRPAAPMHLGRTNGPFVYRCYFPPSYPGSLHVPRRERPLSVKKESMGEKMAHPILPTACDFHGKCRDLLHAANLRHGTDGFTSPPKEGMLIFS
jgi:hypothetical protein